MMEASYQKKRGSIDFDDENAMFATPTMDQNLQSHNLAQSGFFNTDIKFKNSNY